MCGIACIYRPGERVAEADIAPMVRVLRHRGPDGQGIWTKEGIALGHTRLAIIDPSEGAQPMQNATGDCVITYNGELYNFRELRDTLMRAGKTFRTDCDTEVVLAAYEEWGDECVDHFRGMFAFCIADFKKRQLFLARDPLGIKPLCYFQSGSTF